MSNAVELPYLAQGPLADLRPGEPVSGTSETAPRDGISWRRTYTRRSVAPDGQRKRESLARICCRGIPALP